MKKIMFNDAYGLTQATIEGRKTMTRRKISPKLKQPTSDSSFDEAGFKALCCAFAQYKVGEIVAVAQNYKDAGFGFASFMWGYIAAEKKSRVGSCEEFAGWRNKMFVKANLMPHRIRITGLRAERLQDISDEDCIKEGIYKDKCTTCFNGYAFELTHLENGLVAAKRWYETPREAFAALIDKVSGRGTWARNPWVVAYEYELVK